MAHKPPSRLRIFWLLATILVALLATTNAFAQGPIVPAVLFYSPSCSHCQKVMNEVLPPLQEQHGDQLVIATFNVTEEASADLYRSMIERYQISEDRLGVPALVVDNQLLVGSKEIPDRFPGMILAGLAKGGVDWPDIPRLQEALPPDLAAPSQTGGDSGSMLAKFMNDPLANSLAVALLVAMLVSVVWISILFLSSSLQPLKIAPEWVIPALSVVGILVAAYLSFIEVTQTEAFCGPIGDCNAVQQSPYAILFGVLPVGLLGIAGYIAIGAAWLLKRFGPQNLVDLMEKAIWGMALFGVLFMSYLTFLEPFVIGATCAWCLTSSVVITLILWAATPPVINPLRAAENLAQQAEDAPPPA